MVSEFGGWVKRKIGLGFVNPYPSEVATILTGIGLPRLGGFAMLIRTVLAQFGVHVGRWILKTTIFTGGVSLFWSIHMYMVSEFGGWVKC